jgi:hypothetical protein
MKLRELKAMQSSKVATDAEFQKDATRIEKYLTRGDASFTYIDRRIEVLDYDANTASRKSIVRRLRRLWEKSRGELRT